MVGSLRTTSPNIPSDLTGHLLGPFRLPFILIVIKSKPIGAAVVGESFKPFLQWFLLTLIPSWGLYTTALTGFQDLRYFPDFRKILSPP